MEDSISGGAAGPASAVLVGMGSFVGVSQVFYLFIVWTAVFLGIGLFILTYMEGKLCGERSSWVDFL